MYKSKIDEGKSDPRNIWKIFKEFGMNNKEGENKSNMRLKLEDKRTSDGGNGSHNV